MRRSPSVSHKILVADDSTLVRQLLVERLNSIENVEVVAEAADGVEAVDRARENQPDVVLLDLQMPRMSGLQAMRQIMDSSPNTQVVILTNHADPVYRRTCLAAGATHFLDKSEDLEQLDLVMQQFAQA